MLVLTVFCAVAVVFVGLLLVSLVIMIAIAALLETDRNMLTTLIVGIIFSATCQLGSYYYY